nr:hypothetical protein [Tanacetum cinerariifolium]
PSFSTILVATMLSQLPPSMITPHCNVKSKDTYK